MIRNSIPIITNIIIIIFVSKNKFMVCIFCVHPITGDIEEYPW